MRRGLRAGLVLVLLAFWLPLWGALQFPPLSGRVVDQAGLLTADTKAALERLLAAHERESSNQVVVVTLKDLQGTTIEDYGYQLGRAWGIGQKGRDNGVLLIVAPNERKVRIEVGYGLEGTLTDALSHNIIQTVILPQFRKGDFQAGVLAGATAVTQAVQGTYEPLPETQDRRRGGDSGSGFLFLVVFSLIAGEMLAGRLRNRVASSAIAGGGSFLVGLLVLGSLAAALVVAVLVVAFHLFLGPGGRGGPWGGRGGYYPGGFGRGGGGGFSGGGGSFGGGGASGGW